MEMVNTIMDKPDWERKVFDEAITAKWRKEFLAGSAGPSSPSHPEASADNANDEENGGQQDVQQDDNASEGSAPSLTNNMSDGMSEAAFSVKFDDTVEISEKMVDWAINEAKYKAELSKKINCAEPLDGVWTSDTIVPEALKLELKDAVKPLENVQEVGITISFAVKFSLKRFKRTFDITQMHLFVHSLFENHIVRIGLRIFAVAMMHLWLSNVHLRSLLSRKFTHRKC